MVLKLRPPRKFTREPRNLHPVLDHEHYAHCFASKNKTTGKKFLKLLVLKLQPFTYFRTKFQGSTIYGFSGKTEYAENAQRHPA